MKISTNVMMLGAILAVAVLLNPSFAMAAQVPKDISTTTTPIDDEISLEKTVTKMYVPKDNTLPWGAVRGTVSNPVERYPVIIQFFQGDEPVHVAQVNVKGDNSYEYKFRVLNIDEYGEKINIFEGEYTVKIFKVVYNSMQTA